MYNKQKPLNGFAFYKVASGCYEVQYESDYDIRVRRYWTNFIYDMTIIDATKNASEVKKCDVDQLRRLVKQGKCIRW